MILDGKIASGKLLTDIKHEMSDFFAKHPEKPRPILAVVLVGNNPASLAYIKMKHRRAEEIGIEFTLHTCDENISQEELTQEVQKLASDERISGLIIQAPLPANLDINSLLEYIPEHKDIDGFTKAQIGNMFLGKDGLASCTPKGIMTLLDFYHIPVVGKRVAILGRSNIVGKPMALMMINAGATVTSCNSHTPNIADITKQADIIVVAIGKPKFLTKDMVSPDTVVIDVGSNLLTDGTFCGDADFDNLKDFVTAISPSPGGVGPMTIATLLQNTWKAYKHQHAE